MIIAPRMIIALRMERQHLTKKASREEYDRLYRDMQPGLNVYWNGFGDPPSLSFRADFDDKEYNRERQLERKLVKGRFAGGNLGWVLREDMELFACVYNKPLERPTRVQSRLLELIERQGPMNIQQLKEETGLLVKEITPALHRLQEAFLVYEDQYDGEWDRGWYSFGECFPELRLDAMTRVEGLKILLERFAYRIVAFDEENARQYFRLPMKDIRAALSILCAEGVLRLTEQGYMLASDVDRIPETNEVRSVFALHRNDFLYRSNEAALKAMIAPLCDGLEYDCEPLQYLLIDGEFRGASVGHFRNGPYDLNDIRVNLPPDEAEAYRDEIISTVAKVNFDRLPQRYMGRDCRE